MIKVLNLCIKLCYFKYMVLATREDIANVNVKIAEVKAELIKWMFIFWASQLIAIFTF